MTRAYKQELEKEFDRQIGRLIEAKCHTRARLSKKDFLELVELLRKHLSYARPKKAGRIPFVIVLKQEVVSPEKILPLIVVKGQRGEVRMTPFRSKDFSLIKGVTIPKTNAYLLLDVDTGRKTLNVTPSEAQRKIRREKRSPLTIDEGVSLVFHFPEVLTDKRIYNCFSMLASRRDGQQVPALWVSYKKPRLGWCWDHNPHTWLGSGSCGGRV